jgi:ABC-type transport system substrate-binding protein
VNGENGEDDPLFGQVEEVAVECLDDFTIQYTLREAAAFFPSIASMWINWAQPQWLIEESHDASITLVANPFWPGTESIPKPAIKYVHSLFLDSVEQLVNYEAGLLDVAEVPLAEIDRVRGTLGRDRPRQGRPSPLRGAEYLPDKVQLLLRLQHQQAAL